MNQGHRMDGTGGRDRYQPPGAQNRPGPPMDRAANDRSDIDQRHLKLLAIFHYVFSGMCGLFSLVFVSYLVIGIVALSSPETFTDNATGEPLPPIFGILFTAIGGAIVGLGQIMAVLLIIAGRSLVRRKRYFLCFAVACACCAMMPVGTVLGVFTIVVLSRASVKELFARQRAASQS